MSKISNYVRKHRVLTIFLSAILLLGFFVSGIALSKLYFPNKGYYHHGDFIYNGEKYDNIHSLDQGNWELIEEPTKKLGKSYTSPQSLIPFSTLYGFENDPEHLFIRSNNMFLPLVTFMKIKDYKIFDVNSIKKVVVEHAKIPGGHRVGHIEFKNPKDFPLWITSIQELQNGKHEKSDNYEYYNDIYSVYFYYKNVPNARYWVAEINLENRSIKINQFVSAPQYILPKSLEEIIVNEKEISELDEP